MLGCRTPPSHLPSMARKTNAEKTNNKTLIDWPDKTTAAENRFDLATLPVPKMVHIVKRISMTSSNYFAG